MTDRNRPTHTPGPWTFERNGKSDSGREPRGVPYFWINFDAPGHIGGMRCSGHSSQSDAETVANARLIAAAPETAAELDESKRALHEQAATIQAQHERWIEAQNELERVTAERDALLEAARSMDARWNDEDVNSTEYAMQKLRAAIAKAEGRD